MTTSRRGLDRRAQAARPRPSTVALTALAALSALLMASTAAPLSPARADAPATQSAAPDRLSPLGRARAGDWARYRTRDGALHLRVLNVTRLLVEVELRVAVNGRFVGLPLVESLRQSEDWALDQAERDGATIESSPATQKIAGRDWSGRHTVARWSRDGHAFERHTLMSADAPGRGLLRMELRCDGRETARLELQAFGAAEPQAVEP